jgi:hypothetical protein
VIIYITVTGTVTQAHCQQCQLTEKMTNMFDENISLGIAIDLFLQPTSIVTLVVGRFEHAMWHVVSFNRSLLILTDITVYIRYMTHYIT